ncbi:hypothetical protein ACFLTH_03560 [Bacteroidota bacterium]
MRELLLTLISFIALSACTPSEFTLEKLQGAWWSDADNPTADFFIDGNQVWLDFDSEFHPCRIEGDILIFDLGEELGLVKNRIISIDGDRLILEDNINKKNRLLFRQ